MDSSFKEKIWQILALIPEGRVATYGQVADLAGFPKMARAVGRTLSQLPNDTKLPWHRVLNAQGKLSFPVESAPYKEQKKRLEKEGIVFLNGKIRLADYGWRP